MNAPETPETRLGLVALNLWFLGQMLSIAMPAVTEAGPGQWMTSLAAVLMVLAGIMKTVGNWNHFPSGLRMFIGFGFILLVPMTLQGLYKGMDDPLYTALSALPWFAAIFMPALGYPRIPDAFLTCFRWHAVIGVAATAFVIVTNWGTLSAESISRDETLGIKIVQFLLYSLFFQVFRISTETVFHRLVALTGMAQMLIIAFGSGTRQALILIAVVILMAFAVTGRTVQGLAASGVRKAVTLFTVLAFMAAVLAYIYSNLHGAVDLLTRRMTSEREGTSLRENARLFEVQLLLDQFEPVDYMFGRGFRGEFVNTAAPKQDNVHIGWFRTLLKGGLPMVLLLLVGYVGMALRAAMRSRDGIMLAAAFMVIYFGVKNATGNIILPNGHFYIVTICVGMVYAARPMAPVSRPR